MTIKEFTYKFKQIKELGFVSTLRKGPTGIGYTLETLLGINENNNAQPDIDGAELKAHRTKGNSLITLFTFNNKVWEMSPLDAVKK
ncbi:MAG: MvaI/BcnI family restriction endonuclease, partial [Prevotellaceae bacterium]|nr:MvaI/BcnI family restriction endonuclease [Prevotellaceae bacterium]